ncbi:MAG: Phenylalanine--tRNA ligase beta subunit [Holosporales bacterium]
MKFTSHWLNDHLETTATTTEIENALMSNGLEVESVVDPRDALKGFVVGYVESCVQHPNADRLSLCHINDGSSTHLQVVCGAPNVRQGLKVAFARPGCVIPITKEPLKKGSIRGIESQGMLCSARELCLGTESNGIMELNTTCEPGTDLATALHLTDCTFDISITPNRSDCFSVRGIARDLSAKNLGTFVDQNYESITQEMKSVSVQNDAVDACPFYALVEMENVSNSPSPAWLKNRLEAIGQKSLGLLLDIANFVMFDLGQPMHIFDGDKIKGDIRIRHAKINETIKTLGDATYTLTESDLVIADDSGPIALAGIKGGFDSGVCESTKRIYIESALFDAVSIAKTGQRLHLFSDARARFERGIDANQILNALYKVVHLIQKEGQGTCIGIQKIGTLPQKNIKIDMSVDFFEKKTGMKADCAAISTLFEKLGFLQTFNQSVWTVTPPPHRHDILIKENLVEEILRLQGFDHIPQASLPLVDGHSQTSPILHAKNALVHQGLDEVYTFSMVDQSTALLFDESPIELLSPLNQDLSTLRPSLLPSLMRIALNNRSKSLPDGAYFELAPAFKNKNKQSLHLSGIRFNQYDQDQWHSKAVTVDPYHVKADVLAALKAYNINESALQYATDVPSYYHPKRAACIKQGAKVLAYFGEIHPKVLKAMGMPATVVAFEIFVDHLILQSNKKPKDFQLSVFQPVYRDFAFIMDKQKNSDQLLRDIKKVAPQLIQHIQIFDVYEGERIESGKKSIALSIKLQANDRTLTDQELHAVQEAIIETCAKSGAQIRC